MMLADHLGDLPEALEQVRGSAAVALLHDGDPGRLQLAKRASRTLHIAHGDGLALFASTREPLELAGRHSAGACASTSSATGRRSSCATARSSGAGRFHVDRALCRPPKRQLPRASREAQARPARTRRVPVDIQGCSPQLTEYVSGSPWTYVFIIAIAALDVLIPLLPSETSVILAGVLAATGDLVLLAVVVCAALGAVLGDNARLRGRPRDDEGLEPVALTRQTQTAARLGRAPARRRAAAT